MSSPLLAAIAEGVRHVVRRPLRSALTALTSAVAIAVTVNVISLNYGLDEDIRRDIARFGRTTIDVGRSPVIRPGAPRAAFGEAELAAMRTALDGTGATIVPVRQSRVTGRGDETAANLALVATGTAYLDSLSIRLRAGRWLAAEERGLTTCVIDEATAAALFPGRAPAEVLGRRVGVEPGGASLAVVGVLEDPMTYRRLFEAFDESRGARTLTGSLLSFRNVYVPEDALGRGDLSLVEVVLRDVAGVADAAARLRTIWPGDVLASTAETAPPVTVFVRNDWIEAMGGATQTGATFGNIVWILIVLVACILISTLNLVSIRARYDEIAVRRCEGARKRDVGLQITTEYVLTAVSGGILGLPLGWVAADLMRRLVDFPFRFEPRYAGVAVLVSVALGLLSSVVPARRTASLDPAHVLTRRLS